MFAELHPVFRKLLLPPAEHGRLNPPPPWLIEINIPPASYLHADGNSNTICIFIIVMDWDKLAVCSQNIKTMDLKQNIWYKVNFTYDATHQLLIWICIPFKLWNYSGFLVDVLSFPSIDRIGWCIMRYWSILNNGWTHVTLLRFHPPLKLINFYVINLLRM